MMTYYYEFHHEKNITLLENKEICFEDIITLINEDRLLDIMDHPNQKIYVVDVDGYCYLIPYIKNGNQIFLKTIIPSKKATKQYILEGKKREDYNEKL